MTPKQLFKRLLWVSQLPMVQGGTSAIRHTVYNCYHLRVGHYTSDHGAHNRMKDGGCFCPQTVLYATTRFRAGSFACLRRLGMYMGHTRAQTRLGAHTEHATTDLHAFSWSRAP